MRAVTARLGDGLRRPLDPRAHHVVCGDTALAHRIIHELLSSGQVRVTAIVTRAPRDFSAAVDRIKGIKVLRTDRIDADALRLAGLDHAAALALTESDDAANLHTALCAREINPGVRLVIRMFNSQLANGARQLLPDCAVLSDATMAAPAFVAAALGAVAPEHVRLMGRTVLVAKRAEVRAEDVICGLAAPGPDGRAEVLPTDEGLADLVLAEANGQPVGPRRLTRRHRWVRRWRQPLALGWWAIQALARRGAGVALVVVLLAIVIAGFELVHNEHLGWWNGLYVVLLTAAGGADADPSSGAESQTAELALTLAGLALVPVLTAAIVEAVVNVKLARHNSQLRLPWQDHVVVIGLGNVGIRVIRQLHDLGVPTIAIEKNKQASGVEIARQLEIPVIVGDGAQEAVLRQAWVGQARALVVLSTDDTANLQAALAGRAILDDLRVVLRLFDHEFAARVQRAFRIDISRSVAWVAAPTFAAQMLEREVRATIPVDRHVLLLADVVVDAASPLDGAPVSAAGLPGRVRVIVVRCGTETYWNPDPAMLLRAGDKVVAVARRAGLSWLSIQAAAAPPPDPLDGTS